MAGKQQQLGQAEREYDRLKAAIMGIDAAGLRQRWLGSWGVREILSHITGWQRELTPALERLARGASVYPDPAYADEERWSAGFIEDHLGCSLDEIVQELDISHHALLTAAAALPEQQFGDGSPTAKLLRDLAGGHYREHAEQMRDWRQLRTLNARFIHNFITNDVPSHDRLTHPDFVCITARGAREQKGPYLVRWATGFDADTIPYWDTRDEYISLFGAVALVRSVNKHVIVRDGKEATGMTGYTDTYIKEGDDWRCIQAQLTTVSPEHYPGDETVVQRYIRGVPQLDPLPARA